MAPRADSRAFLAYGLALVAALTAFDVAWGPDRLITATVVLGPFLTALGGRLRHVVPVAAVAIAVSVISAAWNENFGQLDYVVRVLVVVAGSGFAVVEARSRERMRTAGERFRLLSAAAELGDRDATVEEVEQRVEELLVPAFADACAIAPDVPEEVADLDATRRITVELRARDRRLGTLTLVVGRTTRRHFTGSDHDFVRVLGGRVALALDNAGLSSELEELSARSAAALGSLAEAVTIQDARGELIYANDAAARLLGYASPDELLATPAREIVDAFESYLEDGSPLRVEALPGRRVLAGEDPEPLLVRAIHRATGEERWRVTKATAVRDRGGRPALAVNVIEDVTEAKRAELAQRFLAAVGEVLAASLDVQATLAGITRLVVPTFADRCVVSLPDEHGVLRPVAAAPAGTEQAEEAEDALVVPMLAAGGAVGEIRLANPDTGRPFSVSDIELAAELGRRAGPALENARLYAERTRISQTLQMSLLPDALPDVPGFALAALYRPAGEESFVGGDFYDAFATERGWMIIVGDVTGRGAEAAALTAQARHTLRTAGALLGDPVAAVEELNRALVRQAGLPICTVAAVLLVEDGDATTAHVVCAGHPQPLLVRGGEVRPVGGTGAMVGAWADARWTAEPVALAAGDVLVLYTDGVIDAVGDSGRFGERRLAETLSGATDAPGVVAGIEAALQAFERGEQADDTAVLGVQRLAG